MLPYRMFFSKTEYYKTVIILKKHVFLLKINKRRVVSGVLSLLLFGGMITAFAVTGQGQPENLYTSATATDGSQTKKFIKWVDFGISYTAMKQALEYDISSYGQPIHYDWIELLSIAACKNGGNFSEKRNSVIDQTVKRIQNGESVQTITKDMDYYAYYHEAYTAVLGNFVGSYKIEVYDETSENQKAIQEKYGLKVFSPIAKGFSYSHSDDFGNGRSYGFTRKHMGNDLMGSVGTPIIAVEDGIVETMGWNRYGGWRIGIRSYDTKRYYYYAHLRKGHPYRLDLKEGMEVKAGDVIGYLGMTGYSDTEDHNGMQVPHLHFGMQLIFDESQKDTISEIWIDVYNIVRLLQNSRSKVQKDETTTDYNRVYQMFT